MGNEAVTRKVKWILNKYLLYILILLAGNTWAQKPVAEKKPSYKKFSKEYKYVKRKSYTGPENNYMSPVPMEKVEDDGESYHGLQYSPQDILRSRQARKNTTDRGGSTGDRAYDPEVEEPLFEINPPDLNANTDIKKTSPPMISPAVWRVILFIIGFLLLAWITYLIVKNYRPKPAPLSGNFSPSDWNPELIPKTELELRLEEATLREDYRECVRIYFTFILKELIRLRRIKWKKDLTNFDYILQMRGKSGYSDFEETVRIYDLVWYGEYEITSKEFDAVVPHLEKNYQSLITEHE